MFVELDTRHDARYTVSLEWDRNTGEIQIAVADSGASSLLVFPCPRRARRRRVPPSLQVRTVNANDQGVATPESSGRTHERPLWAQVQVPRPHSRLRSTSTCRPPAR